MRRTSAGISRTPFEIIGEYRPDAVHRDRWLVCTRSTLDEALTVARTHSLAWSRLIGGQRSPLAWFVIDARDMSVHYPDRRI